MNALNIYVKTCRLVFQSSHDDATAWTHVYKLITLFHQTLSCVVCNKLLIVPMSSENTDCQHLFCKACITKKVKSKQACPGCKNRNGFVENVHYRILLQCHKMLCEYIRSMSLHIKWRNISSNECPTFLELVQEGANLRDEYHYSPSSKLEKKGLATTETVFDVLSSMRPASSITNGEIKTITNGDLRCCQSSSLEENTNNQILNNDLTQTTTSDLEPSYKRHKGTSKLKSASSISSNIDTKNRTESLRSQKKQICRCRKTSSNSSNIVCFNQRCSCYVAKIPCINCSCKGCKNPHKGEAENSLMVSDSRKVFFSSLELKQEVRSDSSED